MPPTLVCCVRLRRAHCFQMPVPRRYDTDDTDEFDDDTDSRGPLWRRRLITWGMAAVALSLGFLIPYTVYLNKQVTQRFGELRWQIPTRVYARPPGLGAGRGDGCLHAEDRAGRRSLPR